jgi:hypothetical protein
VVSNLAESLENDMNIGLQKSRITRENRKSNQLYSPEPFSIKSKKRKVNKWIEDKAEEVSYTGVFEQLKKLRKSHEFSPGEIKSLIGVIGVPEV